MPTLEDGRFEFREPAALCGPDELVDTLVDYRDWIRTTSSATSILGSITDDGLRRLIRLVYFASHETEEGRYLQPRFYVSPHVQPHWGNVIEIEPPIHLGGQDTKKLRKLAPIINSSNRALRIVESSGELSCNGIVYLDHPFDSSILGQPYLPKQYHNGLVIQIDGPGALRVQEGAQTFSLRAGELCPLFSFYSSKGIRAFSDRLAAKTANNLNELRPGLGTYFGGQKSLSYFFTLLLDRIIQRIVEERHGGVIAIVDAPSTEHIKLKFKCSYRSIQELVEAYWGKSGTIVDDPTDNEMQRSHELVKHDLFHVVESISGLANVDGCVVLDKEFAVIGFGGEIKPQNRDGELPKVFKITFPHENLEEVNLQRFGTRHRSAARLCQFDPSALVLVVSQDGDLRIISTNPSGHVTIEEGFVTGSTEIMRK